MYKQKYIKITIGNWCTVKGEDCVSHRPQERKNWLSGLCKIQSKRATCRRNPSRKNLEENCSTLGCVGVGCRYACQYWILLQLKLQQGGWQKGLKNIFKFPTREKVSLTTCQMQKAPMSVQSSISQIRNLPPLLSFPLATPPPETRGGQVSEEGEGKRWIEKQRRCSPFWSQVGKRRKYNVLGNAPSNSWNKIV